MRSSDHVFTQCDICDRAISAPVTTMTDEDRERQRYEKKAELLRKALIEADAMDIKQNLLPSRGRK